jgi:hypothetical protein
VMVVAVDGKVRNERNLGVENAVKGEVEAG